MADTLMLATGWLDTAVNLLWVAVGLGLVIFFHELGHFAVAKKCGVAVERFSIGFGPVLWSFKRGETEYAISLVPFGGYVKMLGQDDLDPSQLTSEEIAADPRSYSAKSVWARMAIISAGVVMNVITGLLFFSVAFALGVEDAPATVGIAQPGMPAWVAGLKAGDRITRINGRRIRTFSDLKRAVALSRGPLRIEGLKADGRTTFELTLQPDESGRVRMIGVAPPYSLRLVPREAPLPHVIPDTPAAEATPPLQPGDRIVEVDGRAVETYAEFQRILAARRAEPVLLTVERTDRAQKAITRVTTTVGPNRFRTLGIRTDIEPIVAIQHGSPAEQAGFRTGDKIATVNGRDVGKDIDPVALPFVLAELHGQDVTIEVVRETEAGTPQTIPLTVRPTDEPGWTEPPAFPGTPLSVPAIGIAYHLTTQILSVAENSPAARAGIQPGDRLRRIVFTLPDDANPDGFRSASIGLDLGGDEKNLVHATWLMQVATQRTVTLTFSRDGQEQTVTLTPHRDPDSDLFFPARGMQFEVASVPLRAEGLLHAVSLGAAHARDTLLDIYLTLRNIVAGLLSVKELRGPLGIAQVAYKVAQQGLPELLLFLGLLSINLAVLNFLPIPVLDGGHMVFLVWEAITRKRPSERVVIAATYLGMLFVLGLMLFVIYLDLFEHKLGL